VPIPALSMVALRAIIVPFLATRLAFVLISATMPWWAALTKMPRGSPSGFDTGPLGWWSWWDVQWYLRVATDGYRKIPYAHQHLNLAFFPLYPVLEHLGLLIWPWSPVGLAMLIANCCAFGAYYSLYQLAHLELGARGAERAIWLFALFPTSFFLAAGYSEALFVLCSVQCLYRMRLQQWWWAGIWGAAAAATRPLGVILLAPFLISLARSEDLHRAKPAGAQSAGKSSSGRVPVFIRSWLAALLLPAGVLAFMIYLQLRFGDPFLFSSSQRSWHRAFAWPWQTLEAAFQRPLAGWPHLVPEQLHAASDTVWALAFLWLTFHANTRLPTAYRAYLWFFWAIVLCTSALLDNVPDPLISLPRFLLSAFPLLFVLAASPRATKVAASIFLPLLVAYTAVFVTGGWVA